MKIKKIVLSLIATLLVIGCVVSVVFFMSTKSTQAITRGEMIENNSGANYTAIDNVIVVGDSNEAFMSAYYLNGGKDGGIDPDSTGAGAGNWSSGQSHTSEEDLLKYYNYIDNDGDGWICKSYSGVDSGDAFTNWNDDIIAMLKTKSAEGKRTALVIHVSVNDYYSWETDSNIPQRYYTEYKQWIDKNKNAWINAGAAAILIAPMTPYPASDGYDKWNSDLENNYNPKIRQLARDCGIDYYDDYTYLSQCLGDNYTDGFGPAKIGSGRHYTPQAYQIMMRCFKLLKHPNTLPTVTLDSVSSEINADGTATVKIKGWTYDPDNTEDSLKLHVHIGNEKQDKDITGNTLLANLSSPDVNKVFSIEGSHRFEYVFKTSLTGTQNVHVCAYDSNLPSVWGNSSEKSVSIAEKATYTIKFDSNGGQGTMENASVQQGKTYKLPTCSFTKAGYTFKGWSTTSNPSNASDILKVNTEVTPKANTTYWAIWEATSNENVNINTNNENQNTNQNVNQNTNQNVNQNQNEQTPADPEKQAIITLSFDANGGKSTQELDSVSAVLEDGHTAQVTIPSYASYLSKDSYTFTGYWNTKKDGSGVSYREGTTYFIASSLVLYAQWKTNSTTKYKVSFDANGGTNKTVIGLRSITAVDGKFTAPNGANYFRKGGYTFNNWNTKADGTGDSYVSGTTYFIKENLVLYAQWRTVANKKYTATFDMNVPSNINAVSKKVINPISTETGKVTMPDANNYINCAGYSFAGWTTDSKGNGTIYLAGNEYTITSDTKFYAKWESTQPTTCYNMIKFNPNGGVVYKKLEAMTIVHGQFSVPNGADYMSKRNCTFLCWNTKANGTGINYYYEDGALYTVNENLTLYAIWTYKTTYYVNIPGSSASKTWPFYGECQNYAKRASDFGWKRSGYTFVGWNTKPTGVGTSYAAGAVINSDVTKLYAQWKKTSSNNQTAENSSNNKNSSSTSNQAVTNTTNKNIASTSSSSGNNRESSSSNKNTTGSVTNSATQNQNKNTSSTKNQDRTAMIKEFQQQMAQKRLSRYML